MNDLVVEPPLAIEMTVDDAKEWEQVLKETLPGILDEEVPEDQRDAFWVKVNIKFNLNTKPVMFFSEVDAFCDDVNRVLGNALSRWRLEMIYVHPTNDDSARLLLLMNIVSLQDIMSLGV